MAWLGFQQRTLRWLLLAVMIVMILTTLHLTTDAATFGNSLKSIACAKGAQHDPPSEHKATNLPPTWEKLRKWEMDLPQHNLDAPHPEGREGRYVLFMNQGLGGGWNNLLSDILLSSHLAYKAGRSYVFQEYLWNLDHMPYSKADIEAMGTRPSVPLNALLSGPTVGGSWGPGDPAPRAVTQHWFDIVCPKSERRIVDTNEIKRPIYFEAGDIIFNHWQKFLYEAPEKCIEIRPNPEDNTPQTFDLWFWGGGRGLVLWDEYKNSPVSKLLRPSPLVKSAVARNEYLFHPSAPVSYAKGSKASADPFERMMAVHLRRGDYEGHCPGLANWNSTFYSWNLLPFLPDHFEHPPYLGDGKASPEAKAIYLEHCWPNHDAIMKKVRQARKDYLDAAKPGEARSLDVFYLLTNDHTNFVVELKKMLLADGWHTVVMSDDLDFDQEQRAVNMAVDMDIARQAAVFIGNGWSSYTSNIVHYRLVDGKEPITVRLF